MQTTPWRTFEIERGEGCVPFKFAVHTRQGVVQVTRVSPYDETEYHWASKSTASSHWRIIRKGRTVFTIGTFVGGKPDGTAEPLTPEQIAYFLIKADMNSHLEPRICHN